MLLHSAVSSDSAGGVSSRHSSVLRLRLRPAAAARPGGLDEGPLRHGVAATTVSPKASARCAILAGAMVLSADILAAVCVGDIRGVEAALAAGDDVNDVSNDVATVGDTYKITLLRVWLARLSQNEDARTGMLRFLLENGADPHAIFPFACMFINADRKEWAIRAILGPSRIR